MQLSRFRLFPVVLAALVLAILPACKKELANDLEDASNNESEPCPDLGHTIAALDNGTAPDRATALLAYFTPEQVADLRANTCLTVDPPADGADDRAAGLKGRFWTPGATIRVRFLNGSPALQDKVFNQAKEWEQYANIHFVRVAGGAAEVRVLFGKDGYWSYIGTFNQAIDACKETMGLEFTDATSPQEIRRVVLHEFGHVLGLLHEHQQPLASIPWNAEAVYAYYAQQDWDRAKVDEQVLDKDDPWMTQYTEFDRTSIMEYPVSASLTTNGFSIGWNTQLSQADKNFISLMYGPNRARVRHAVSGYQSNITFRVAGIYHTLKPGESVYAPVQAGGSALAIQELNQSWDEAYSVAAGKSYKIVRVGNGNDWKVVAE